MQHNKRVVTQQWIAFGAEIKTAYEQTKLSVELLLELFNDSNLLKPLQKRQPESLPASESLPKD